MGASRPIEVIWCPWKPQASALLFSNGKVHHELFRIIKEERDNPKLKNLVIHSVVLSTFFCPKLLPR
jgi:hypothetical protein